MACGSADFFFLIFISFDCLPLLVIFLTSGGTFSSLIGAFTTRGCLCNASGVQSPGARVAAVVLPRFVTKCATLVLPTEVLGVEKDLPRLAGGELGGPIAVVSTVSVDRDATSRVVAAGRDGGSTMISATHGANKGRS